MNYAWLPPECYMQLKTQHFDEKYWSQSWPEINLDNEVSFSYLFINLIYFWVFKSHQQFSHPLLYQFSLVERPHVPLWAWGTSKHLSRTTDILQASWIISVLSCISDCVFYLFTSARKSHLTPDECMASLVLWMTSSRSAIMNEVVNSYPTIKNSAVLTFIVFDNN